METGAANPSLSGGKQFLKDSITLELLYGKFVGPVTLLELTSFISSGVTAKPGQCYVLLPREDKPPPVHSILPSRIENPGKKSGCDRNFHQALKTKGEWLPPFGKMFERYNADVDIGKTEFEWIARKLVGKLRDMYHDLCFRSTAKAATADEVVSLGVKAALTCVTLIADAPFFYTERLQDVRLQSMLGICRWEDFHKAVREIFCGIGPICSSAASLQISLSLSNMMRAVLDCCFNECANILCKTLLIASESSTPMGFPSLSAWKVTQRDSLHHFVLNPSGNQFHFADLPEGHICVRCELCKNGLLCENRCFCQEIAEATRTELKEVRLTFYLVQAGAKGGLASRGPGSIWSAENPSQNTSQSFGRQSFRIWKFPKPTP